MQKNDTIQDIQRECKGTNIFYTIEANRSNGLGTFIDSKLVYEELKLAKETDPITIQIIINNATQSCKLSCTQHNR